MVTEQQIQYWQWIASYYMCTIGEVMSAALPSYLKLESETFVVLNDEINIDEYEISDDEFLVLQALQIRKERNEKKIPKNS